MAPSIAARQVIAWLIEGNTNQDICENLGLNEREAVYLFEAAAQYFATVADSDPSVLHGFCLDATREMYRRLVQIGDYPNALRALKQLHSMLPHVV